MTVDHWESVKFILNKGIEAGDSTFETEVPEWPAWDKSHLKCCRFVALENDKVMGWVALSGVSDRCVYGGVAEVSIYVDPAVQGQGVGSMLMEILISESEKEGFWTLQAGIFPENQSSIKLHEKSGFRRVGIREKLGKMNNQWRNVILLERRSKRVGID